MEASEVSSAATTESSSVVVGQISQFPRTPGGGVPIIDVVESLTTHPFVVVQVESACLGCNACG